MWIGYCVQAEYTAKWKQWLAIARNEFICKPLGGERFLLELPYAIPLSWKWLQNWQKHRVERKLVEWVKKKRGKLVLEKTLQEKLPQTKPWQMQENLKLPALFAMLSYYFTIGGKNKQEIDLTFVCKEFTKEAVEIVKELAQEYRSVQVVTEQVAAYRTVADRMYEENATLITVSNHSRKALQKAKWIIYYEPDISYLYHYTVCREATLFLLQTTLSEVPVGFCGIVVNQVLLTTKSKWQQHLQQYDFHDIVSSFVCTQSTRQDKQRILEKLEVEVQALQGINGTLSVQELAKKVRKLLTK